MGCGCKKGNAKKASRGAPRRGNLVNTNQLSSQGAPPPTTALTQVAAQKNQSLMPSNNIAAKSNGGIDKDRREIERKRRLMILNKLGTL